MTPLCLVGICGVGLPLALDQPGPVPDWKESAAKTVAVVNATFGEKKVEPATAFFTGWQDPILFMITAAHVVEVLNGPDVVRATKITVTLDASVCDRPIEATVVNVARDLDLAALSVPLPSSCTPHLVGLRRAHLSSLLSPAAEARQKEERLAIIGRAAEGGRPVRQDLSVRTWGDPQIVFGGYSAQLELSGAPLYSHDGELVGMVTAGGSDYGQATNYARIRTQLIDWKVPTDLAGDFAELVLSGYPVGSVFTLNGSAERLAQYSQQVAPARSAKVEFRAPGYDPASTTLELPVNATIKRCIHLVRPIDRTYATYRLPLILSTAAVAALAVGVGLSAKSNRDDFNRMPTRTQYDLVNQRNWEATVLFGAAALGAGVLGTGQIFLEAERNSVIDDCRRDRSSPDRR